MNVIRILHLEDNLSDAEFMAAELKKKGIPFSHVVVSTKEQFINSLAQDTPDIIICDHSLPAFNSLEALKIVKQSGIKIPFVLLTGNTSDEFAANIIKAGADDYILKDRMKRLPSAILSALYKSAQKKARTKIESDKADWEERTKMFMQSQNDRLENFVQIISHNLISYSHNIDVLLHMYTEAYPPLPDDEIMQHLKAATTSLNITIKNLKELVMMNGGIEQNLTPINLAQAIDSAINVISHLHRETFITITNKVDKNITIWGFKAYIDSILLNFITNSIKYRSDARIPDIVFTSSVTGKFTVLKVKDNGVGIDLKKNKPKLFGLRNTFNGNKDANGMGLFITKNQVEAMGGKIEVESELNKGTLFKIYLKSVAAEGDKIYKRDILDNPDTSRALSGGYYE
jgi:signal transduction histidine kinase